MAYECGSLFASLDAIAGIEPDLQRELRAALAESAALHADRLTRSRCDANWLTEAHRLKGLAASFGANELLAASQLAIDSAPGDPVAIRQILRVTGSFSNQVETPADLRK